MQIMTPHEVLILDEERRTFHCFLEGSRRVLIRYVATKRGNSKTR
jgi:hypothetical protein